MKFKTLRRSNEGVGFSCGNSNKAAIGPKVALD